MEVVAFDTNVVIVALAHERDALEFAATVGRPMLPFAVVGELYFGAAKSRRVESNQKRLESFLSECDILQSSTGIVRRFGKVKAEIRAAGTPIPENDVWIAACALEAGIGLATRDRHFDRVRGLDVRHV